MFWIDIECIIIGFLMIVLHVKIILRTQGEYIKRLDEIEEMERQQARAAFYAKHGYSMDDASGKMREKYLIDPTA